MCAKKASKKPKALSSFVTGLSPEQLNRKCKPSSLGFDTTDELPDLQSFIGQPRAFRALEMGSEVTGRGFNIFVMGLPASGRTTLSREYLENLASKLPIPDDLCYVNNFKNHHQPNALVLPVGEGAKLRKNIKALVAHFGQEIQQAFDSEEYHKEREKLIDIVKKDKERALNRLQVFAAKYNFIIARTTFGFVLVPAIDGQPLKPEEIESLPSDKLEKYKQLEAKVSDEVKKTLDQVRELERETYEKIRDLDKRTALYVVEPVVSILKKDYENLAAICTYLDNIQQDIVENVEQFRAEEQNNHSQAIIKARSQGWFDRYDVNVLIDNSSLNGAPVILENQPTYHNLIGRIEHQFVMGASKTDFMMIRPGALHRANGGYLILPIRDVLINPYAWEGLKRSLNDGYIRIAELGNQLGLISTVTLEPEPIPLNLKIILVGTPLLYYLLRAYDEDFEKLFKIRAEFTTQMDRTPETEREYSEFVRSVVLENQLMTFDNTAVARIIEHGSRMVSNQNKLSTRFGQIADLIREAEYWAKKDNLTIVKATSIEKAIEESIYRSNLPEDQVQELIAEGIFMIDVEGRAIGQINALAVITLGDYAFARPHRITATVTPGRGGVIDIERKAELGGPIHTKGVLIISGFLSGRFGQEFPLSLSASLTFEQSYSGVEGDSASAAELLTLLSALAGIPVHQDIAITGSVNQHGDIQAIGGVNEKIEGFFNTCQQIGLTGTQGVVIPAANLPNLMLTDKVIRTVEQGRFHIWAIKTIDEAMELLSGIPAGIRDNEGNYPEKTFNHAAASTLAKFKDTLLPKEPTEHGNTA